MENAEESAPMLAADGLENYFASSEAKKLFIGDKTSEEDVESFLEERIDMLARVNAYPAGWRDMVEGRDKDNLCSAYEVFVLRQRCQLLCSAYTTLMH